MLSKHGIEIGSAKAWLDSDAQPEMYNGGCFGDLGHIPHLPKTEGWRTRPPAVVGTGVWERSPPALKNFVHFLAKMSEF